MGRVIWLPSVSTVFADPNAGEGFQNAREEIASAWLCKLLVCLQSGW